MLPIPIIILAITNEDDREFMKKVYLDYSKLMFAVAMSYVEDSYAAEDIVSDSCAALIDKIEVLRNLNDVKRKRYVLSTARNKALDHLRSRKRYYLTGNDQMFDQPDTDSSIDERLLHDIELHDLVQALSEIKPSHRMLLHMKYSELLSDAEIAQALGIGVASVRSYLSRAKKALREVISKDEE